MSTTNPTDIPTEWEELQIKYGNFSEKPKRVTNEERSVVLVNALEERDILEEKTLNELNTLEDDVEEETLNLYRKRRLEELARAKERNIFGSVVHVTADDYVKQITEASKLFPDRNIILLLYVEHKSICQLLVRAFNALAPIHAYAKICKAIGSNVIPHFPESRIPTVLVYHNGACIHQFLGAKVWGGNKTTKDTVEWVLWKHKVLEFSKYQENPLCDELDSPSSDNNKRTIKYQDTIQRLSDDSSSNSDDHRDRTPEDRGYSSTTLESAFRLK